MSYAFLILFLALVKVHVAQKNVSLPQQVRQNVVYAAFLQNLYLHYIPLNLLQQNHIFVCTVQLKDMLFGVLESIDFIVSLRRLSTRTTMSIDTRWVSVVEFHDGALGIGKVFGQESTVVKWNY